MSIFQKHFPLGLGTNRFLVSGPKDIAGMEKSVELVSKAINRGVDYIDIGFNYSAGMAPVIMKEAFQKTGKKVSTTVKVMYGQDKTADDARKRVELYLNAMGLEKAAYFTSWTIWDYKTFEQIMQKGGIYEGALKLKEEGLVDHICCSLHASPDEIVKIIESKAFEGITVSYSILNAATMQKVLDTAYKNDIGVAVMNPLGGGIISQNKDYFSFACGDKDDGNAIHSALRFAKAHPAVNVVLGGVSCIEELEDSLSVLATPDPENLEKRKNRVLEQVAGLKGFCTGCKYCTGCPKGIPTSEIMKARNTLLFDAFASYNRTEPAELLYNLQIFRELFHNHNWLPESKENPCVQCGKCEKQCTQKLSIIEAVEDTYRRAGKMYFNKEAHKERLKKLLCDKGYKKVGLYPNGGFSKMIIELYEESFGKPEFEWLQFNSDPKTWGQMADGRIVHGPGEILDLKPNVIIICTYKYDQDIYDSLKQYEQQGIKMEKLHRVDELPWVF